MYFGCFLLLILSGMASSQTIVENLPGFGKLPFKLETGYIGVGELEEAQLFYYFIESERDPRFDPLILWLSGNPGCSSFRELAFANGPITFDVTAFNGSLPLPLKLNPYSWTKVSSIIFLDAIVGTGFSYATTTTSNSTSNTELAGQIYNFLRKWLINHPNFLGSQIYMGGDSYAGMIIPILVQNIQQGIQAGLYPYMYLQGYVLGNPATDKYIDLNSRIPFAHRVSLISDEYYEGAKLYCEGDYINIDYNNSLCVSAHQNITECLLQIEKSNILEPLCSFSSKKPRELQGGVRSQEENILSYLKANEPPELWCPEFGYALANIYMNDKSVQSTLGVQQGTVKTWSMCQKPFTTFTENVNSTVEYHKNLSETGLRALIYSGDHDLYIPYMGTQTWIRSLEIPVSDKWRPWYVDGQIAGYQVNYKNSHFQLLYVTVKGAGHTAPQNNPKQCLLMVDRFFAHYPI